MTSSRVRPFPIAHEIISGYSDNGLRWSVFHILARATGGISRYFEVRARDLERRQMSPGTNSIANNRIAWSNYDWSGGGDEWTSSTEWRRSVIDRFMTPYVCDGATIVEIGPGAGRWTGELLSRASTLYLVDITETTLGLCRKRFGDGPNLHYILSDGRSLPRVPDKSADFIWSYDTFVHIAPADQHEYAREFARVMKPGARAVIHHVGDGGRHFGWRSAMTADLFRANLEANGLREIDQVTSWGPALQYVSPGQGDIVTIFEA
jgi:SAM-dependent methyltransferase